MLYIGLVVELFFPIHGGCMDSMLAKVIDSRQKSIVKLEAEIVELEAKRKGCSAPAAVLAYDGLIKVRAQRRTKLVQERDALIAEATRQVEIPGTQAEPAAPSSIPGRKR